MSGHNLPYHLRVKKDIERRLFVEQLRLISKVYDLEEYSYIGMAGPFSEDFKLMFDRFNFKHFFSYETNASVYKRQNFNSPFSQIYYLEDKISKSIDEYPSLRTNAGDSIDVQKSVLWLDYTGFEHELIADFEQAIGRLEVGSVVKITLLAHASQLCASNNSKTPNEIRNQRIEKVKESLGTNYFLVDVFENDKMTEKKYPGTVFELLKKVAHKALLGSETKFLPLSSYIYQDGMVMLTFTGIIIKREEEKDFLDKTGLYKWNYGLCVEPEPMKIEVPFLSLKEKLNLDACIPASPGGEMAYIQKQELESYKKFYRFYPTFAKIV